MEVFEKQEKIFKEFDNKKVEIVIVNHERFSCLEIIVLGVRSGNKPVRMYLNSRKLAEKINAKQFNEFVKEKEIEAKRQHKSFHVTSHAQENKITMNLIVKLIISRLQIIPSTDFKEFDIFFELGENELPIIPIDLNSSLEVRVDFEYDEKPDGLIPYTVIQRHAGGGNFRFVRFAFVLEFRFCIFRAQSFFLLECHIYLLLLKFYQFLSIVVYSSLIFFH
jgi:hypothetical protein